MKMLDKVEVDEGVKVGVERAIKVKANGAAKVDSKLRSLRAEMENRLIALGWCQEAIQTILSSNLVASSDAIVNHYKQWRA